MNVVLGSISTAKDLPVAAVCVHIAVRGADNINLHADRIEFENGLRCYQRDMKIISVLHANKWYTGSAVVLCLCASAPLNSTIATMIMYGLGHMGYI